MNAKCQLPQQELPEGLTGSMEEYNRAEGIEEWIDAQRTQGRESGEICLQLFEAQFVGLTNAVRAREAQVLLGKHEEGIYGWAVRDTAEVCRQSAHSALKACTDPVKLANVYELGNELFYKASGISLETSKNPDSRALQHDAAWEWKEVSEITENIQFAAMRRLHELDYVQNRETKTWEKITAA